MHVRRLHLVNFRSYAALDVDFSPGITTFLGSNGQGKTNLVESIVYVATHSSHRVASDSPLVANGSTQATIGVEVARDDRSVTVEIEINPGRSNRARVNRSPVTRARDALGILRVVVFAPEDLSMVKGDPAERRAFLDDLLVQRTPRLAGVRSDYDKVLKQRNALLKSAQSARRANASAIDGTLEVWDGQLARFGSEITAARLELIDALRPRVVEAYDGIAAGRGPVKIDYASSWLDDVDVDRSGIEQQLLEAVASRRREELDRGITVVGPHRDDLSLRLRDNPVRGYASHGEAWSTALAMRLAAFDLLRSDGDDPILILDDVFAELDSSRRAQLADAVAGAGQVLITAAVAEDVPAGLTGESFTVHEGRVTRG